jgi:transposase-like protein
MSPKQRILDAQAQMRRAIQEPGMRKPNLNRIVAVLRTLTPSQLTTVSAEVAALEAQSGAAAVVEGRFAAGPSCPHCHSQRAYRHGQANGLQRYRCRECLRTFNALSGTPLSGLHKREKWFGQAAALQDGRTLRTVAKDLGVHIGTAHRWRHRFLALPQALQPEALAGIAEADETMFLLSFKGQRTLPRKARQRGGKAVKRGLSHEQVPVLVARDRSGVTADCVLRATDAMTMAAALKPFVSDDVVLCTDGSSALAAAARTLGVEHHAVNLSAGVRVDGAWHVQNVNAYHSRLKTWVRKFNGVATRYLENYLGWFRTLDRESHNSLKPVQWLALAMGPHA